MPNRQRKYHGKSREPQLHNIPQQPQSKQFQPQSVSQHYSRKRWSLTLIILIILMGLLWVITNALNAPSWINNTFYAFFTTFSVILALLKSPSSSSSTEQISNNGTKSAKRLFLKYLWQNRIVRASAILVILLFIFGSVSVFSFARCSSKTAS